MTLRTDPTVRAMQHNARELAAQGVGNPGVTALAGAGTDVDTAAAISTDTRVLVLSGANTTGVKLPANEQIGSEFTIYPPTANAINLFPPTGESIGAAAPNAAAVLTAAKGVVVRKLTASNWGIIRD